MFEFKHLFLEGIWGIYTYFCFFLGFRPSGFLHKVRPSLVSSRFTNTVLPSGRPVRSCRRNKAACSGSSPAARYSRQSRAPFAHQTQISAVVTVIKERRQLPITALTHVVRHARNNNSR